MIADTEFLVEWSGQDNEGGSGIASYDIFVSINGGDFTLWLDDTTDSSAIFTGERGHSYAFYSLATDVAGNTEAETGADAVTTVDVLPAVLDIRIRGSQWSDGFPYVEGYSLLGQADPESLLGY